MVSLLLDLDDLRCAFDGCRKVVSGGRVFLNREEKETKFSVFHEPCLVEHEKVRHLSLLKAIKAKSVLAYPEALFSSEVLLSWLKRDQRLSEVLVYYMPSPRVTDATMVARYRRAVSSPMLCPPRELEGGLFRALGVSSLKIQVNTDLWNSLGPQKVLADLFHYLKVHVSALSSVTTLGLVYPLHVSQGIQQQNLVLYLLTAHHLAEEHKQWKRDKSHDLLTKVREYVTKPRERLRAKLNSVADFALSLISNNYTAVGHLSTELMPYSSFSDLTQGLGHTATFTINGYSLRQSGSRPSFFLVKSEREDSGSPSYFQTLSSDTHDLKPARLQYEPDAPEVTQRTRATQMVCDVTSRAWRI